METASIVAIVAAVASITGAVLVSRSARRANDVNEQAANLAWVKELRQDAIDTRRELEKCQEQVRHLSRQLDLVTREADHWIAEHQNMRNHAFRRGMSIDRLRAMWPEPPTAAMPR